MHICMGPAHLPEPIITPHIRRRKQIGRKHIWWYAHKMAIPKHSMKQQRRKKIYNPFGQRFSLPMHCDIYTYACMRASTIYVLMYVLGQPKRSVRQTYSSLSLISGWRALKLVYKSRQKTEHVMNEYIILCYYHYFIPDMDEMYMYDVWYIYMDHIRAFIPEKNCFFSRGG